MQNTQDNTYNGWPNYETWLIYTWITNEEKDSLLWQSEAQEAYRDAAADDTFTRHDRACLDLRSTLKEHFEESAPDLEGFWADLLNSALEEVQWYYLAEHFIDENCEEEEV